MVDVYSRAEWTQIGIFLVGLPAAALIGALVGLVGKWKQGQLINAALIGMGCAALAAVVCFLTFFVVHSQSLASHKSLLLEFFDSYMGPTSALLATCVTGVISLLAAIGLRGRRNDKSSAAAFSMRQLLLLQLFAFIALGCWVGMRSFALRSGSELERTKRIWSRREWHVEGNEAEGPSYWQRSFDSTSAPDMERENAYFREIVRVPSLRGLQLFNIPFADELAIEELASAKDLQSLYLAYGGQDVDQRHVSAIGSVRALRVLSLRTSGKLSRDIGPIASLPKLDVLLLHDCTISPASLERFAESTSLRRLFTYYTNNPLPKEVTKWPAGLVELQARSISPKGRWNFEKVNELKALKTLLIATYGGGPKLSSAEAAAIARCESLEFLTLEDAIADEDLPLLESLKQVQVLTIKEATAKRSEAFRAKLQRLAMLPKLVNLNCDHQIIMEDAEWANQKAMPTNEAMEERRGEWILKVNQAREAAGLPLIRITFSINSGAGLILGGSGGGSGAPGEAADEK